jgi:TDG/mug DNA glycosylase family protein
VKAVSKSAVPDVLAPDLDIVFCGINPGRASAAAGAHFANPRNDFWRLLDTAGFTPRLFEPHEQHDLLALGVGLTNAARRTTRGSSDLRAADFAGARERLEAMAEEIAPQVIAFVVSALSTGSSSESSVAPCSSSSRRHPRRTLRCRGRRGCTGFAR